MLLRQALRVFSDQSSTLGVGSDVRRSTFLEAAQNFETLTDPEVADKMLTFFQGWINPGDAARFNQLHYLFYFVAFGHPPVAVQNVCLC